MKKRVLFLCTHNSARSQMAEVLLNALYGNKYEVFVESKRIELTSTEFRILKLFLSNKSKVFSRYDILDHLWGHDKIVLDRTIDVHIKNLRDKLGKAGKFIKNIRGVGYKLEE